MTETRRDHDPHHGHDPEVDPVTGYETTGHDWNGIRELNTPFPRLVVWALAITFAYSVVAWVLLPAWPIGRDATSGLLGLDQRELAREQYQALVERRSDWLTRFDGEPDFAALAGDQALMARAMPAADRLFRDNCALCHGDNGLGGPGYPNLADGHWLWGGSPATIAETLHVGINADHPDTRAAQMPAFGWMQRAKLERLADYVAALPTGQADPDGEAAQVFAQNCVACHGEGGQGGMQNGAPALTDDAVIYGQNPQSVMETLRHGRQGVMPAWSERLSTAEINLLALYTARLIDDGNGNAR